MPKKYKKQDISSNKQR